MADPVLLLIRPCVLMLFDHLLLIIVDGSARHKPMLRPPLHGQRVDIIHGLIFRHIIPRRDPPIEQFLCLYVNPLIIRIHTLIEGSLRPVDGQKGIRVFLHNLRRLSPVIHIIGQRRNLLHFFRHRPYRPEHSDIRHSHFRLVILLAAAVFSTPFSRFAEHGRQQPESFAYILVYQNKLYNTRFRC